MISQLGAQLFLLAQAGTGACHASAGSESQSSTVTGAGAHCRKFAADAFSVSQPQLI
jgi:hypothetical protein